MLLMVALYWKTIKLSKFQLFEVKITSPLLLQTRGQHSPDSLLKSIPASWSWHRTSPSSAFYFGLYACFSCLVSLSLSHTHTHTRIHSPCMYVLTLWIHGLSHTFQKYAFLGVLLHCINKLYMQIHSYH